MNSIKLYLESIEAAYNTKFNARVISIDGNKIGLDRTLFYPIGGGKNWDTGRIIPVIMNIHCIADAFSDRYMYVSYGGSPPRTALGKC